MDDSVYYYILCQSSSDTIFNHLYVFVTFLWIILLNIYFEREQASTSEEGEERESQEPSPTYHEIMTSATRIDTQLRHPGAPTVTSFKENKTVTNL